MKRSVSRRVLMITLSTVLLNFALMLAAFYATSGPLPERARIVPLFATFAAIVTSLVMVRGKSLD